MKIFNNTFICCLGLGILVLFGTVACNKQISLSHNSAIGAYEGHYPNGAIEVFMIRPNGTFSQVLSTNGSLIYSNAGQWKIDKDYVVFQEVLLANDVWNISKGKPALVKSFEAHWNPVGPAIVFSDDSNYWVIKTDPKPERK